MITTDDISQAAKNVQSADIIISLTVERNPWWKRVLIGLRLMKDPLKERLHTFKVMKNRFGGFGTMKAKANFGLINVDCEDIDNAFVSPKVCATQKTHSYNEITGEVKPLKN